MTRRRRRFLRSLVAVVLLGTAAFAAAPWWAPAVGSWYVRRHHGEVGDWTSHGWSGVTYQDVVWTGPGVRITVGSVRVPVFGIWPVGATEVRKRPIEASDVRVEIVPAGTAGGSGERSGAGAVFDELLRGWKVAERRLPPARVGPVVIEGLSMPIHVAFMDWDGVHLSLEGTVPRWDRAVACEIERGDSSTLAVRVQMADVGVDAQAELRSQADGFAVRGELAWRGNTARGEVVFSGSELVPASATLEASSIEVPADVVGWPGYEPLRGSLRGTWTGGVLGLEVKAHAEPLADADETTPALDVDLRAEGDLQHVRVGSMRVELPGLRADLSHPVEVALPSGIPSGAATFALEADLARLTEAVLAGRVTGRVDVQGGFDQEPSAEFDLSGAQIAWRDLTIDGVKVAGTWKPAHVVIRGASIDVGGGSRAEVSGAVDLSKASIENARFEADVNPHLLSRWMKRVPPFVKLHLAGEASGPWMQIAHRGDVELKALEGLPGGLVDGVCAWSGQGLERVECEGAVESGSGVKLPFVLAVERGRDESTVACELRSLAWQDGEGEWWRLSQPAAVVVRLPGESGHEAWTFAVDGLKAEGAGVALSGSCELAWPGKGRVDLEAHGWDAARVASLLPASTPRLRIDDLGLRATWDEGPATIEGRARVAFQPDATTSYAVDGAFRTEESNLAVGELKVLDVSGVVLEGQGRVPLVITGEQGGFRSELPMDGALDLHLESASNPKFWESIARLTGWEIEDPRLSVKLQGSLRAPRGEAIVRAGAIRPPVIDAGRELKLPLLESIELDVQADADGIRLVDGQFAVEGNWLVLSGLAPWSAWRAWREGRGFAWREGRFEVAAAPMPVALVSRSLPTAIAPDGTFSFRLTHTPETGFDGRMWVHDVSLRPIAPVGAVRDINGELDVKGYVVSLPKLAASLGGRPIEISGTGDLEDFSQPAFDLKIGSGRLPLVRRPGMALRAAVDIEVRQERGRPAHISGAVEMGQSVFVSDLESVLPTGGGVTAPEMRPPYFSVRDEPFARWTLDVAIRGDEFLRVENPFFRGTVSADFRLLGTLGEPRVVGVASVDRGTVVFPFGSLQVDQFELLLSEQNPFDPVLFAQAGARVFGYDLRMEVTGTAGEPRLLFTSDPALTSQQVFLLLTTGAVPDEERAFSATERAQRVAVFVGRNLASRFGLTGAGDGGEERLIVRSGEDFSRAGGETLEVQLNIDGRWSLVGERDRFDGYNGGIKFRLIDR